MEKPPSSFPRFDWRARYPWGSQGRWSVSRDKRSRPQKILPPMCPENMNCSKSWDSKNCWYQMVTLPARVLHHDLVLGMRVLLKGPRLSLIIGQARGRKGWDGKTSTAFSWDSPKVFPPPCTSIDSSQPTHRNHKPGFTWDYEHFITIEGSYVDVSGILPSMRRKK